MTDPEPNGAPPVEVEIERWLVAAVLADPTHLRDLRDLAAADLGDPHARRAFMAVRNVEAAGAAPTPAAVRARLAAERQLRVDDPTQPLNEHPQLGDLAWFDRLVATPLPAAPRPVVSWAHQVMRGAARRAAEEEQRLAAERAEADDNDFALRDAEPPRRPAVDPFLAEFKRALGEVARALGDDRKVLRAALFVPIGELFRREYPQTPWFVTGLVRRGGVAMLAAEPKSGKTWLATEIAVAIATATKVGDEFFAERGTVAYFYAEDLDVEVRNRVRALAAGREIDPASIRNLYVCPRGKFIDVTKNEDVAWIVASCRSIGRVDAVVLDPLRDIHSGEEDKSDSMRDVMRRLRLIGELLGCTVIVAHHMSKLTKDTQSRQSGQRMRGSGAIHGSTDSGIYFGIRGGDGVARFELEVDVQIKGARSAGKFIAALQIEDDAGGEAVKAIWTIDRSKRPSTSTPTKGTDDKVFAFVRDLAMRGIVVSRRALRDHDEAPLGDKPMRAALDRLVESGRLVLDGPLVRIPGGNDATN